MITPIHRIAFKFSKHLFWKGLFIVLIFCSIQAKSQVPTKKNKCGTYEALEQFRLSNPKAETDQQFEDWIKLLMYAPVNMQGLIVLPPKLIRLTGLKTLAQAMHFSARL